MRARVDSLDIGVGALRALMKAPLPWQRIQNLPVVFYLGPGRFIAHGSGTGAVFISMFHVRSGGAPYLHEASHELLAPQPPFYDYEYADSAQGARAMKQLPLWLFEGLPDVLAQLVTAQTGLREGDVFSIGGLARVDSTCAARIKNSSRGAEVLASVGRSADLAALFTTDRPQVAPVFYACSQSLTKYFVDQMGVENVISLFPAFKARNWEQQVAIFAKRNVETLRSEWLTRLGLSAPITPWADDPSRVEWLRLNGRSLSGRHVVVWAPNDSLSDSELRGLVDSLDIGVAALRVLMKAPLPWQRIQNRAVVYYLAANRFIAHASGTGAVFISMYHVRAGQAPYLHEAVHELLVPPPPFWAEEYADSLEGANAERQMPIWLVEGLADVLALKVARQRGLHEGDVLNIGGLERADSTCAARIRSSPRGAEVLAAVGRTGDLTAPPTDRPQIVPAFYTCSQSLTKYIVEQIGVANSIALFPAIKSDTWRRSVARFARRPMETLRFEWLKRLGLAGL